LDEAKRESLVNFNETDTSSNTVSTPNGYIMLKKWLLNALKNGADSAVGWSTGSWI